MMKFLSSETNEELQEKPLNGGILSSEILERKGVFCLEDVKKLAKIRTDLAEERTELAWQRNRLSEMGVLLGVIGLGLLAARFYNELWLAGAAISTAGALWLAIIAFRYFTQKKRMRCA